MTIITFIALAVVLVAVFNAAIRIDRAICKRHKKKINQTSKSELRALARRSTLNPITGCHETRDGQPIENRWNLSEHHRLAEAARAQQRHKNREHLRGHRYVLMA